MIAVISPAKSLDFEKEIEVEHTLPRFHKKALELINVLHDKSEKDVQALMNISQKLASLNVERYQNFTKKKDPKTSKQALYAFQGDVYQGLEADTFSEEDVAFAQDHLRILSGLYGLLRPLDLIQPYRLEMGTQLKVNGYNNLYEFWDDTIAKTLNRDLKNQGDKILINLASKEYFKSINLDKLKARIIDVEFLDENNGEYRIISFYAKKARGMMSKFIIDHKLSNPEDLRGFDYGGYLFDEERSSEDEYVFKRG